MLPKKRSGEGVVVGGDSVNTASDSGRVVKKQKTGCLFGSTNENTKRGEVGNGGGSVSRVGGVGSAVEKRSMALGDGNQQEIDEDLHSRQLAVYGRETMRRLFASNVLVSGMQGLGAEIAKNLILAGVKSVTLHDEGNVELWDLSCNFNFSENDIGKNRALASVQKLQELNNAVVVTTLTKKLTKEQLSDFQWPSRETILKI